MAHGDALIFLTNITWIFVLFLFVYLFFVVYFLPLFYKKFRIRALVGNVFKLRGAFFFEKCVRVFNFLCGFLSWFICTINYLCGITVVFFFDFTGK